MSLPVQSLPDVCAAIVRASHAERLQVLDAVDLGERFKKTLPLLIRQIEVGIQVILCSLFICSNLSGTAEHL